MLARGHVTCIKMHSGIAIQEGLLALFPGYPQIPASWVVWVRY